MAIRHKRSETYERFVFDPEDIGDPYYLIGRKRVELIDVDEVIAASEAGKKIEITRDIKKGAQKIIVTYRVLTAWDVSELTDQAAKRNNGEENPGLGAARIDAVRKAVVGWSLEEEVPWNDELLHEIDDTLLDQIYFWVRKHGLPEEQNEVSGLPLDKEPIASSSSSRKSPADRKPPANRQSRSRASTRTSRADTP